MTDWSPQQSAAIAAVSAWLRDPSRQILRMAGFAGCGKSTIAKHLIAGQSRRWLFAAPTGKAAHVLKSKGCAGAQTIHSLIYKPSGDVIDEATKRLQEELNDLSLTPERRQAIAVQLLKQRKTRKAMFAKHEMSDLASPDVAGVIVDEASMVDRIVGADLVSFGKKLLILYDPGQLPPVYGSGYFTATRPDIMLTDVHRQARDSGVLRLATHVREHHRVSGFAPSHDARIMSKADEARRDAARDADQVIVGMNKTRHDLNRRLRAMLQRTGTLPYAGDRLVCLRNDRETGLLNGSQWTVDSIDVAGDIAEKPSREMSGDLVVYSDDDERYVSCTAWMHHFLGHGPEIEAMGMYRRREAAEFDWGYAMTCHKAQGSQWDSVFVVDESAALGSDPGRWLYTAVTRAAREVTVLV